MARKFANANDGMSCPTDSSPGLNNNDLSVAVWVYKTAQPAGIEFIWLTQTQTGGGSVRGALRAIVPAAAGFKMQWFHAFGTTNGNWEYATDLALNTRYHLAVTYNRSATTNDPVLYVNGTSVAVTETITPLGTSQTGGDSVRSGLAANGTGDLKAIESHQAAQGGLIWDAAAVNRAMWWGRPHGGLQFYQPLVTDKLTNEGSDTGATYTVTGAVVAELAVPTVPPGSAMMGLGVGW